MGHPARAVLPERGVPIATEKKQRTWSRALGFPQCGFSKPTSPGARFEKIYSRTVIEHQDPAESRDRGVRAWGFWITVVHKKAGLGRSLFFSPLLSEPQNPLKVRERSWKESGFGFWLDHTTGLLALAFRDANVDAPRRHLGVFLLAHEIDLGGADIGVPREFPHLVHRG